MAFTEVDNFKASFEIFAMICGEKFSAAISEKKN